MEEVIKRIKTLIQKYPSDKHVKFIVDNINHVLDFSENMIKLDIELKSKDYASEVIN